MGRWKRKEGRKLGRVSRQRVGEKVTDIGLPCKFSPRKYTNDLPPVYTGEKCRSTRIHTHTHTHTGINVTDGAVSKT